MAMALHQRLALELRKMMTSGFLFQKFAQQHCLLLELLRQRIIGKKIGQFIAEDRSTAWLQYHDRDSSK